jgi:hypothetical protein
MMKKGGIKIVLDIIMLILLILLLDAKAFGAQFHEIAGLLIGAVFISHIFLNWRFIRKTTPKFLSKQIKTKTRIECLLAVVLFLSFLTIIVSGALISQVLFPHLRYGDTHVLKTLHNSVSYMALLLVGFHLGLNWNWIIATAQKLIGFKTNAVMGYISKGVAVIILLLGIYGLISVNLLSDIAQIGRITERNHQFEERVSRSDPSGGGIGTAHKGRAFSGRGYHNGAGIGGDGKREGKGYGPAGRSAGNADLILKLGAYLGIVGGSAVVSYYLDRFFNRKKRGPEASRLY